MLSPKTWSLRLPSLCCCPLSPRSLAVKAEVQSCRQACQPYCRRWLQTIATHSARGRTTLSLAHPIPRTLHSATDNYNSQNDLFRPQQRGGTQAKIASCRGTLSLKVHASEGGRHGLARPRMNSTKQIVSEPPPVVYCDDGQASRKLSTSSSSSTAGAHIDALHLRIRTQWLISRHVMGASSFVLGAARNRNLLLSWLLGFPRY